MKVFVHLAHGAGYQSWKRRWQNTLGVNHDNVYGYRLAEEMGCQIEQSEDTPEGKYKRLLRLSLRRIFGFDMLHTWTNRKGILTADVVWTHTEMESMAVLLLFRITSGPHPKLIAQTVWLIDEWEHLSLLRRKLYHALLSHADILTFLSPLNRTKAQSIFPRRPTALVLFGIRNDVDLYQPCQEMHEPLRILTVGNDRHRDWKAFVAAFRDDPRYVAKMVISRNAPDLSSIENITREHPITNDDLFPLFRWADVTVVPLKANLHASGITAIQEAVQFGLPIICSDTGGLRAYFRDDEVTYVPIGDATALRAAVDALSANCTTAREKARRALERMKFGNLNSRAFVAAHVAISGRLCDSARSTAQSSES